MKPAWLRPLGPSGTMPPFLAFMVGPGRSGLGKCFEGFRKSQFVMAGCGHPEWRRSPAAASRPVCEPPLAKRGALDFPATIR